MEMTDKYDDIPKNDLERLRREASRNWCGATIAFLRFQQLVKEFRASRNKKSRKTLTLSIADIDELLRFAHPQAAFQNANQEFVDKKYPGWKWNEIIPRLFTEGVLYKDFKSNISRPINSLFLDKDIYAIQIFASSNNVKVLRRKKP